jgi:hypothetical protein
MTTLTFQVKNLFNNALEAQSQANAAIVGVSTDGIGTSGYSNTSAGAIGVSVSGTGVEGFSNSGQAGYFQTNFGLACEIISLNGQGLTITSNNGDIVHWANASGLVGRMSEQGTLLVVSGANVAIQVQNTSSNTTFEVYTNGSILISGGIVANGSFGANGTTLHSNGSSIYWA